MKKWLYFLIIPLFAFTLHKFHLSNTKVVYDTEEKSVQIIMRCFVDDIEKVINQDNNITLELGNEREIIEAQKYLKEYLNANFEIRIDNIIQNTAYLGKEIEKDIIFFYLEIENVQDVSSIQIKNTVLLETFEDQQNVIRIEIKGKKKTFVLKNDNYIEKLQL